MVCSILVVFLMQSNLYGSVSCSDGQLSLCAVSSQLHILKNEFPQVPAVRMSYSFLT
jgi:hypothetical protein